MADAVAEEIDDLKREMAADFEGNLRLLSNRVENV